MSLFSLRRIASAVLLFCAPVAIAAGVPAEHEELEASIDAPFRGDDHGARVFGIELLHPGAAAVPVAWQLEIASDSGVLRRWNGNAQAGDRVNRLSLAWDGRDDDGLPLRLGIYRLQFAAIDGDTKRLEQGLAALAAGEHLANPVERPLLQEWDVAIGTPPPVRMPSFVPLPVAAQPLIRRPNGSGPAYTIYYGNLHSQTNHSDGGGDLSTCNNAEAPQDGAFGPVDAFAYARGHGLDFLMASEHNHMYDGSNGTNANALQQAALDLYQSGLDLTAGFNTAHPDFLAIYGMEWGVTTNGGHLNIIGADALYGWEYNVGNQLIGSFYTPKSDYASLYTFMRGQQVLGQFNHPASSGQFVIDGVALAQTADGDDVMVLAEVLNSSAFSISTTEEETSRTSYESVWKKLLERGYHVAPASNQDNHCANWGASYGNRTAVLIPAGLPLNAQSFHDALRARRVFATTDKTGQILLSSREHVMGSRFANDGALTLRVDYASGSGRVASQVQIYEGVPGRNGTITLAAGTALTTLNPSAGEHFYYAKITQDDGRLLWSAPIWVTQLAAGDAIFQSDFF